MPVITYETYDSATMEYNLNVCKDAVIGMLCEQGHLTSAQADEYMRDYHVMIAKPSVFARWWKKFFSGDEDEKRLIIVKNITLKQPEKAGKDEK